MRTARKISIIVVALVVLTVGMALPAQAGTEGAFLSKINASRSAAGLPPVSVHADLTPDARAHSAEMMAAGEIYHTSGLSGVATGWEALAENVGVGPSVDSLHTAFMNSAGHRRNILGDYNYVGIGASQGENGELWVTVIFMRKGAPAATTTTTTTAPTTTTTVPQATTTTTTAPPATTTTTAPATATPTPAVPAPAPQATTTTTAPTSRAKPVTQAVQPMGRALHLPQVD